MTEQELEEIISDLAYRRKHADEDSAEYKMIMRQLAGIRREGQLAARILEERSSIQCTGGDRSNNIAAEHDRNETGNDTAGANFHSKRKPAGHDHSDHRRSQSRSHGQENERGREAEGRYKG